MTLASNLDGPRSTQRLLLLQSSIVQSALPLLRHILSPSARSARTILFCFLHPPSSLVNDTSSLDVYDYLDNVAGYNTSWSDTRSRILRIVEDVPASEALQVIIDAVDILSSDIGSNSETCKFLSALLSLISARTKPSRLILHICTPCQIHPYILFAAFSSSLTQMIAHPPVLFTHLATEYLTPPPPLISEAKFWGVFIPFSERGHETERLTYGSGGEGAGGSNEMVVEVLVRGGSDASGRRKPVERSLEGWNIAQSRPVELRNLETLTGIWKRKIVEEVAPPDPTQNISFKLELTPSQQESRARVPLPYTHEGRAREAPGAILYDPDSADDIDDDDPDEDLDI